MKNLGQAMIRVAKVMDGLSKADQRRLALNIVTAYAGAYAQEVAQVIAKVEADCATACAQEVTQEDAQVTSSYLGSFLSTTPETTGANGGPSVAWPEAIKDIPEYLTKIHAPGDLFDPRFWTAMDAWLGSDDSGVGYLDELPKYLAWNYVQPKSKKHKDHQQGFRNWLAKSEYWSQHRAQTQAIRSQQRARR